MKNLHRTLQESTCNNGSEDIYAVAVGSAGFPACVPSAEGGLARGRRLESPRYLKALDNAAVGS